MSRSYMALDSTPDNANNRRLYRDRLKEVLYTICSQFAICSFRYNNTDLLCSLMAKFEIWQWPVLLDIAT